MAQNLPRGTPARVLVLLTLLIGLVAVSAWRDALRQEKETWIRHPTALGDTGFLMPGQLPAELVTGGKLVSLEAGSSVLQRRDDRMFRVPSGGSAGLPFTLFTSGPDGEGPGDPQFYGRVAPHQYRRLAAQLGPAGPASQVPASLVPKGGSEGSGGVAPVAPKALPLEDEAPDLPVKPEGRGAL